MGFPSAGSFGPQLSPIVTGLPYVPLTATIPSFDGSLNVSANIPTGVVKVGPFPVPTLLNTSAKSSEDGHGSCYVGWGVGTGANLNWPRTSLQTSSSSGNTNGFNVKAGYSSPGIFGVGYASSNNYYLNGVTSSASGVSTVGGSWSASVTAGYTINW
jgi:hypothetical protein